MAERLTSDLGSWHHFITPHRKIPWRLSDTRKANVRKRLREVDAVIQAVKDSGVECEALVIPNSKNLAITSRKKMLIEYAATFNSAKHWNFPPRLKCLQRISTLSSRLDQKVIARGSTKCKSF